MVCLMAVSQRDQMKGWKSLFFEKYLGAIIYETTTIGSDDMT